MSAFIRHKVLINSGVGEAVHGGFDVVRDPTKATRVGGPGLLFITLFVAALAIFIPIVPRFGGVLVRPILWLYTSRDFSMGLSLIGSVAPTCVAVALSTSLIMHGHRALPKAVGRWLLVIGTAYVAIATTLPITSPVATAVLLSLNTPMILAVPLIFITAFELAHEVERGDYWVAAEAYVALFIPLALSDSTTAVIAGVATETVHLFTKASFVISNYGAMDGLVLIPTKAAIAALITTAMIRKPRNT
jgi:hypothetical protein